MAKVSEAKAKNENNFPSELVKELEGLDLDLEAYKEVSLPGGYELELMAAQLLEHVRNVRVCEMNIRANQAVNNQAVVSQLTTAQLASKIVVARILKEHPQAKALMGEIAEAQTKLTKQNRSTLTV